MGTILTTVLGSVAKNFIVGKLTGQKPKPAEFNSKGLITSKTALGGTGALVMFLLQGGWPETPMAWGGVASAIVVYALTLYGRIRADKAIG